MYIDQVRLGPYVHKAALFQLACYYFFFFRICWHESCLVLCRGFCRMECVLVFPTSLVLFPIVFPNCPLLSIGRVSFVSLMSLPFSAPLLPKTRGQTARSHLLGDTILSSHRPLYSQNSHACLLCSDLNDLSVFSFISAVRLFVSLCSFFRSVRVRSKQFVFRTIRTKNLKSRMPQTYLIKMYIFFFCYSEI